MKIEKKKRLDIKFEFIENIHKIVCIRKTRSCISQT